jgi:hypothetical protein
VINIDYGFDDWESIAGRILAAHALEEALRNSDRDDSDVVGSIPLLVYVNPARYAPIAESFSFPLPEGFSR